MDCADNDLDDVPSFSTGSTFLDANAQAHHKPLSAFGDLTDNAREAQAQKLQIDVLENAGSLTITMTDNGKGMSELRLRTGIGGIGHSDKAHHAEVHYGMGAKSSLPRLSPSSLVFSKNGTMRTVALISTTLSRELGSQELKVPVASWAANGYSLLRAAGSEAPLTFEQRYKSLLVIMQHTPFKTERDLLAEFANIPGPTGTRLVLFQCDREQYDITSADDIRLRSDDEWRPPHEVSLRSYLEVLYYCDATTTPALGIELRGTRVQPRNWSAFLAEWPKDRPAYTYNPRFLHEEGGDDGKAYGATVRFGTTTKLAEVIEILSAKKGFAKEKREIEGYTGVFYYNHDRMIMPLVRLPKQNERSTGNQMMTTEKNLTLFGTGVVGVCREGFLLPEHNKSGYEAKSYDPSVYAKPNRPSFQDLHKIQVNDFFKRHLKEVMMPAYQAAKEARQQERNSQRDAAACPSGSGDCSSTAASSASSARPPPRHAGGTMSNPPPRAETANPSAGMPAAQVTSRGKKRKSVAASGPDPEEFHEGGRYCLRDEPSVVGESIKQTHGWFCLKLTNGTCTRSIRYGEMREVGFERCQVPEGFMLVDGALLDGVPANITWYADDGEPPKPMFCRLRASQVAGTICADYFDDDKELLHIAIRPSDAACVAFDSHGAELQINPEDMCAPNSLMMDCARIESTAASLRGQALFLGTGGSDGKGNVAALLSKARLTQYTEAALQHMKSDAFVESLAASVGMKPGHLARLKYYAGTESAQP